MSRIPFKRLVMDIWLRMLELLLEQEQEQEGRSNAPDAATDP